jgi:hypothetical protein
MDRDGMTLRLDEITNLYVREDGLALPRVTTVIDPLVDDRLRSFWTDEVRERGTRIHQICQWNDEGTLDEASVAPEYAGHLRAWRRFLLEYEADVVASEQLVSHPLGYAGRLDRVLDLHGENWVVDIKSGPPGPTAALQTAAYEEALNSGGETRAYRRMAVRVRKDGTFQVTEYDDPEDWLVFQAALVCFNFKERSTE